MIPAPTLLPDDLREGTSEANNDATEIPVHGGSGQNTPPHGEDHCPSAVECAPSGGDTPAARPAEAPSVDVTRSLDALGVGERSKRGGGDDTGGDTDSDGSSSSSSGSPAKKRRQERAATDDDDQRSSPAREDGRELQGRDTEGSTPRNNSGSGADVTHHGDVGRGRERGTTVGVGGGELPRTRSGRTVRLDLVPGFGRAKRRRRQKRACGRDVCGVVFGVKREPCTDDEEQEKTEKKEEKEKRLCSACHRPSQEFHHFTPTSLSRVTEMMEDAKTHGAARPCIVLEGYQPTCDCLCAKVDCIYKFVQYQKSVRRRRREYCDVCKRACDRQARTLNIEEVAEAVTFFTVGKGAKRRDPSVDCTGTWMTEMTLVCGSCHKSLYRGIRCRDYIAPTPEVREIETDRHTTVSALAKKRAKFEIRQRLDEGRVVTSKDAVDILVEERRKLRCKGQGAYERRMARDIFREVVKETGGTASSMNLVQEYRVDLNTATSLARKHAKVDILQRLGQGRVITVLDAFDILVEERRKLGCKGQEATYVRKMARDLLKEVVDEAGDAAPLYLVEEAESEGSTVSALARNRAKVELRRRVGEGRVVTEDDAFGILAEERRKVHCKGQDSYERKMARCLLKEVVNEACAAASPVCPEGQAGAGVPQGSSNLTIVPAQISPQGVADVLAELDRIRAGLRTEREEAERLQSATAPPVAAGLDATTV